MSVIRAKQFKGYSTKSDKLWDNPSLLSRAEGVIINKGSITNIPIAKRSIPTGNKNYIPFLYNLDGRQYIITISWNSTIRCYSSDGSIVALTEGINLINTFVEFVKIEKGSDGSSTANWLKATAVQVGDWLYLYSDIGLTKLVSIDDNPLSKFKKSFGRMIRVKLQLDERGFPGQFDPFISVQLVGVPGILKFVRSDVTDVASGWGTSNGKASGHDRANFALTLVWSPNRSLVGIDGTDILTLDQDSIESIALEQDTPFDTVIEVDKVPKFLITLGSEYPTFTSVKVGQLPGIGYRGWHVGVYVRTPNESIYKFIEYVRPLEGSIGQNIEGQTTFLIQLSSFSDPVTKILGNKVAPLIDQFPVLPGLSAAYYNRNLYVSTLDSSYVVEVNNVKIKREVNNNLLQVSKDKNAEFTDQPNHVSDANSANIVSFRIANYINGIISPYIGNTGEGITGLIEYKGQLYIFKSKSTWLLTDDVEIGELREEWPSIGCVGINGGRAYVVANNRLFWVSSDAVWMYDGTEPVKISELIEEDLRSVDKLRYETLRLGYDETRELIYVCFPLVPGTSGKVAPFICSINDGFAWTRGDPSRQLNDVLSQSGEVYYFYDNAIEIMDTIDAPGLGTKFKKWAISTGIITLGDEARLKHWKDFFLQGISKLRGIEDPLANGVISMTIFDAGTGKLLTSFKGDYESLNRRLHLGVHSNGIRIDIRGEYLNHFRINGYKLTVNQRGRK